MQIDGVIGLLRADTGPKDTHHVFGDVYVTSGREPLEDLVAAGADPSRFRAYLGYAGWSPGQLERETAQGSWRVLKSVAGTVFDPNPDSLWNRLINQTDGLSAGLAAVGGIYVGPNFSWAFHSRFASTRPRPARALQPCR